MPPPPPDKQPAAETLEWIAESIARRGLPFSAFINSVEYTNALYFIKKEVLSALRNERERCAKKLDERVQQCDAHVKLNDQQGREYGYGCWRDIANALRHAATAIREGK